MTIEQAIKHAREVAEERKDLCEDCRSEHLQLALWLEELKSYKDGNAIHMEATLDACRNSYIGGYYIGRNETAKKIYDMANDLYCKPVSTVVAFNQLLDWLKTEFELEVTENEG